MIDGLSFFLKKGKKEEREKARKARERKRKRRERERKCKQKKRKHLLQLLTTTKLAADFLK